MMVFLVVVNVMKMIGLVIVVNVVKMTKFVLVSFAIN